MNESLDATKHELLSSIEASLDDCASRAMRTRIHQIIPFHFFSVASSECRKMFIHGHFYGCISLAQALAEALARFVARRHTMKFAKDPQCTVDRLKQAKLISESWAAAFDKIWGDDRNDFHHLNENVKFEYAALESRAEECVSQLYIMESELFAYELLPNGGVRPLHTKYWPENKGTYEVCVRFADC